MTRKSWKRGFTLAPLALALAWPAHAATIFGTITQKGKPVANAHITLSCAGLPSPATTQTDARGTYHFSVTVKGYCTLKYESGATQSTTKVILEPTPNQYDFEVATDASGAHLVRG